MSARVPTGGEPERVELVDDSESGLSRFDCRRAARRAALIGSVLAAAAVLTVGTPRVEAQSQPSAVPTVPIVTAPSGSRPDSGTSPSVSVNGSEQAAVEPSGRELETRAIEDLLERYRNAFNRLDAGAASAVWPTVDQKTLARAFERLRFQHVIFSSCQIVLGAMFAEATCIGSTRHEPIVGSRATKPEPRRWRFGLRKPGGSWLIDRVDMR